MMVNDTLVRMPGSGWERQWLVLYCAECRTAVEAVTDQIGLTWEALPSGHGGSSLIQGGLVRDEPYVCPPCRGEPTKAWPPQMDPSDPATLRGYVEVSDGLQVKRCLAPLCGKSFRAKHGDARFCSRACIKKAARRRRNGH